MCKNTLETLNLEIDIDLSLEKQSICKRREKECSTYIVVIIACYEH